LHAPAVPGVAAMLTVATAAVAMDHVGAAAEPHHQVEQPGKEQ
jgi:hypothetical protein